MFDSIQNDLWRITKIAYVKILLQQLNVDRRDLMSICRGQMMKKI